MTEPLLEPVARWIAAHPAAATPAPVAHAARLQVLDALAAALAASRSTESASVVPALRALGPGGGDATVVGLAQRLPPVEAALANAALSMAQDFDDIVWMGHTCHSAVFAPLAVAEHEGRGAADFLDAVVVANEVAGRLGASSFLGPLNGQMWTFIHLAGAAAAAARLLRLDAERARHALAIALAQPTFALQPGFMRPTSKLLAAATPTATGIRAAYFARAGMTGAAEILEDPRGFFSRFTFVPLPGMLEGLGTTWVLQTLAVKTFPGCFYFQTACTALERILARTGRLAPERVAAIRVDTTKLGSEVTRFARDYLPRDEGLAPVNVNFDLAVTLAILLHAGELTSRQVEPEWLAAHREGVLAFKRLIRVEHDPRLTAAVVRSARAMESGRRALGALGLGDVLTLSRRYRDEYRSKLLSLGDARRLMDAARSLLAGGPAPPPAPAARPGAVPLLFPNRVRVRLRDGAEEQEQVDLPVGALASPDMEEELERKWRREATPSVGERAARRAWKAGLGLGLGESTLDDLLGPLRPRGG